MSEPASTVPPRRRLTVWRVVATAGLVVGFAAVAVAIGARDADLQRRLLDTPATEVMAHPDLVRYATKVAKPLFAKSCAQCHGADMKGLAATGAPNLTDDVWLYGDAVYRTERTILYGIRSGQRKANDIAEMPAYGQRGQLSEPDIRNVVQYLLQLSHRPHDADAAELGRAVYAGPGACFDCHAGDARGNTAYGAPDLTRDVWDYGGSPQALYDSIYYGRHGLMPAWVGKLTMAQVRALAVYVHARAKPDPRP